MAKVSGGSRALTTGSKEYNRRIKEIDDMLASCKYESVEMGEKGGYLAIEKSPAKHKPEEIEAARNLADKGYKVILKDESGQGRTPDGYVFSLAFEQRTPNGGTAQNFKKALDHAASKPDAQVAVVYMKKGDSHHTKQTVEDGIVLFEEHNSKRFVEILVVTDEGKIHKHRHNK